MDSLMECPYNSSHLISVIKMPYHLMKCRKNSPNMDLVVCPFDATHEVKKAELMYHMLHCPHRVLLERDVSSESFPMTLKGTNTPIKKGYTDLPRYQDNINDTSDDHENWDTVTSTRTSRRRNGGIQWGYMRLPLSFGKAAELSSSMSDSKQYSTASQENMFNSDLLCLGRGRALAISTSPPSAISSVSTIRTGQSSAFICLGRGLAYTPTSRS